MPYRPTAGQTETRVSRTRDCGATTTAWPSVMSLSLRASLLSLQPPCARGMAGAHEGHVRDNTRSSNDQAQKRSVE